MKKQLVLIHGGETFRTRSKYVSWLRTRKISLEKRMDWKNEYLEEQLADLFEIIRLRMPSPDNARYSDWEIHFERHIPFFRDEVMLLGNSLGGVFLAKYLSRKKFPRKIKKVVLVAPPFDNSIPDEDLVNGFSLRGNFSLIGRNCADVHFFFSPHDDVVPIGHCEKYRKKLSNATFHILEDISGHFQMAEFPEVVKVLKSAR